MCASGDEVGQSIEEDVDGGRQTDQRGSLMNFSIYELKKGNGRSYLSLILFHFPIFSSRFVVLGQ